MTQSLKSMPASVTAPGRGLSVARFIPTLAELALICLIAWILARFIWLIAFGASALDFRTDAGPTRAAAASAAFAPDLDRLRDMRLFADRRSVEQAAPAAANVPETRLNLSLTGIRLGATPQSGGAIIQTPDNRQAFFAAGASIIDGVSLAEVQIDHVIINRRGIRESLYLRDQAIAASQAAASSAAAGPASVGGNGSSRELAGLFQVEAVLNGDRLSGYRLTGGNETLLTTLGLRLGDVVVSVDGRTLSDVDDLNEFFEDLEGRDTLAFSILRGGRPLTLQVDLP
ncbi:MAG: general secretion pathway protein C [Maricaulis sp.]|jgi:general secretion pathway protein C